MKTASVTVHRIVAVSSEECIVSWYTCPEILRRIRGATRRGFKRRWHHPYCDGVPTSVKIFEDHNKHVIFLEWQGPLREFDLCLATENTGLILEWDDIDIHSEITSRVRWLNTAKQVVDWDHERGDLDFMALARYYSELNAEIDKLFIQTIPRITAKLGIPND